MDKNHLNNLIKKVFQIEWKPAINEDALQILDNCHTNTERLYLMGAAYFIEQIRNNHNGQLKGIPLEILGCDVPYNNKTYEGIWFLCPWDGWLGGMGGGPTACAFVPQLRFPEIDYHHDFGLFYGQEDGGGAPWHFQCAIEIDPNFTHHDTREIDEYRDKIVNYDVVRIYDEIHNEISWFKEIIDRDDEKILKHIANASVDHQGK